VPKSLGLISDGHVYPLRSRGEAHEGLSLMFARDGVPHTMITDYSLEQAGGAFKRKCKEVHCRLKHTEPYTPWSNAAEGTIRELKRGVAHKMCATRCPKALWDDCLELEAFIRSNTASASYRLQGEVPETLISGETADISEIAEFGWYQWGMFRDSSQPFPDERFILGRYLGPSTDIGPAMTAKILMSNGQVVHWSTFRALNQYELESEEHKTARHTFTEQVNRKLGDVASIDDYAGDPDYEIPTHKLYEDGTERHQPLIDRDDLDDDAYDQYVKASVNLPRGASSRPENVMLTVNPSGVPTETQSLTRGYMS